MKIRIVNPDGSTEFLDLSKSSNNDVRIREPSVENLRAREAAHLKAINSYLNNFKYRSNNHDA